MLRAFPTAVIENLHPLVDGGRYPIKRVVGEDLVGRGGRFQGWPRRRRSGAEMARSRRSALARNADDASSRTIAGAGFALSTKTRLTNTPSKPGRTRFAAGNTSSRRSLKAGIAESASEALEGATLLEEAAQRAPTIRRLRRDCASLRKKFAPARTREVNRIAQSGELEVLMATYPDRSRCDAICAAAARGGRSHRSAHCCVV